MPDSEVALFGVTGSGKSSVVNLLVGKPVANVSTDAEACTKRAQWYPITLGGKKFRLWDTMGFNQAEAKDINPLSPHEQAHSLLRNLQEGVDLILLCARKEGINASLRSLYWLLNDFFFVGQARIALVLTRFDAPPDQWWDQNKGIIEQRCNIPVNSLPHACITTVRSGFSSLYDQSKQRMRELLLNITTIVPAPTPAPLRLDLQSSNESTTMVIQRLRDNCSLSASDAAILVEKFKAPKRVFQVILFGEAGVGKSSIINLISGLPTATVSSSLDSCTLDSRNYKINTGLHQFLVWDTVGLNGTHIEHDVCRMAIEKAVRLVRDLHRQGGVDLLVYCRDSRRLSHSETNCFRLFQEFLCEGQIPVAFIVTRLENEDPMEKWWEDNGDRLVGFFNLKTNAVAGHACITSVVSDNLTHQDKLAHSRQSVLAMLEDSISYGSTLYKDEGTWVMSFLRRLIEIIRVGNPSRKEKITVKNLMESGLSRDQAKYIIRLLYPQD